MYLTLMTMDEHATMRRIWEVPVITCCQGPHDIRVGDLYTMTESPDGTFYSARPLCADCSILNQKCRVASAEIGLIWAKNQHKAMKSQLAAHQRAMPNIPR